MGTPWRGPSSCECQAAQSRQAFPEEVQAPNLGPAEAGI